jgi:hypothetical protein
MARRWGVYQAAIGGITRKIFLVVKTQSMSGALSDNNVTELLLIIIQHNSRAAVSLTGRAPQFAGSFLHPGEYLSMKISGVVTLAPPE